MIERELLILVGASVRAAAFSARRAGFEPIGLDLFADRDLRQHSWAEMISRKEYPHRLPKYLDQLPHGPWMYTGGLENRPELLETMAARRPLWGCDAKSVRLVRSPEHLQTVLRREGIAIPEIRKELSEQSVTGRWLTKPRRGAGGSGISFWDGKRSVSPRHFYFQKFIDGRSLAAIYCARPDRTLLIGVTEQWVGERWLNARPFAYCGSVGPLDLPDTSRNHLRRLGEVLTDHAGLRGLFGVDLVEHDGCYYVIEVNPRYTASVEVLEYAMGRPLLREHAAAFDARFGPSLQLTHANRTVGKAILFAAQAVLFPDSGPWDEDIRRPADQFRHFADVPMPGSALESGWPILTLLAEGGSISEVRDRLREAAHETTRLLRVRR